MKTNEHNLDRLIRIILGIALLALVQHQIIWGWLGFIPLLTGIFGFCPLYRLFRFRTD